QQRPPIIAGQLQPQQLIRTTAPTLPFPKPTTIPVQPLEVQQPLTEGAVPRLMHPHHAVDAFHRTGCTHHPAQHPGHPPIGRLPLRSQPPLHHVCQRPPHHRPGLVVTGPTSPTPQRHTRLPPLRTRLCDLQI